MAIYFGFASSDSNGTSSCDCGCCGEISVWKEGAYADPELNSWYCRGSTTYTWTNSGEEAVRVNIEVLMCQHSPCYPLIISYGSTEIRPSDVHYENCNGEQISYDFYGSVPVPGTGHSVVLGSGSTLTIRFEDSPQCPEPTDVDCMTNWFDAKICIAAGNSAAIPEYQTDPAYIQAVFSLLCRPRR